MIRAKYWTGKENKEGKMFPQQRHSVFHRRTELLISWYIYVDVCKHLIGSFFLWFFFLV